MYFPSVPYFNHRMKCNNWYTQRNEDYNNAVAGTFWPLHVAARASRAPFKQVCKAVKYTVTIILTLQSSQF